MNDFFAYAPHDGVITPARESEMLWKIIGAIVVIWLVFAIASAILKSLIPLVILGLILVGAVTVYRNMSAKSASRL